MHDGTFWALVFFTVISLIAFFAGVFTKTSRRSYPYESTNAKKHFPSGPNTLLDYGYTEVPGQPGMFTKPAPVFTEDGRVLPPGEVCLMPIAEEREYHLSHRTWW